MKESYTIAAYHCRNCGACTNPDKPYCDYCSGKLLIKRIGGAWKRHKARLLIECNKDYVYLDDVMSIDSYELQEERIETTSLSDSSRALISAPKVSNDFGVDIALTGKTRRAIDAIKSGKRKVHRARMELLEMDIAFELETRITFEMPEFSQTIPIRLEPYSELKVYDTVVPENVCCPNCGARITSKYGACDYCGGWVEWSF